MQYARIAQPQKWKSEMLHEQITTSLWSMNVDRPRETAIINYDALEK